MSEKTNQNGGECELSGNGKHEKELSNELNEHAEHCTCGHEHHHHEHGGHEYHEHGGNCTCNECESEKHEHEHEHAEHCACGHEHHHEHGGHDHHEHGEHCTCGCEHGGLEIDTHEGALIATFVKSFSESYEELKKKSEEIIVKLRDQAKSRHYLIGHIKGYIEKDDKICTFSTTGGAVSVTERETGEKAEGKLNVVCIVFGAEKSDLKEMMNEACSVI